MQRRRQTSKQGGYERINKPLRIQKKKSVLSQILKRGCHCRLEQLSAWHLTSGQQWNLQTRLKTSLFSQCWSSPISLTASFCQTLPAYCPEQRIKELIVQIEIWFSKGLNKQPIKKGKWSTEENKMRPLHRKLDLLQPDCHITEPTFRNLCFSLLSFFWTRVPFSDTGIRWPANILCRTAKANNNRLRSS